MKFISLICLIIAFAVDSSLAKTCYVCDSSVNPGCINLKDSGITAQTCDYSLVRSQLQEIWRRFNWQDQIGAYNDEGCQNITTTANNVVRIIRRCAIGKSGRNPCEANEFLQTLNLRPGEHLISCEFCHSSDSCNSANALSIFWIPLLLVIGLIAMFV